MQSTKLQIISYLSRRVSVIELDPVIEDRQRDEEEEEERKTGANDDDDADDAEDLSEEDVEDERKRGVDRVEIGREPVQDATGWC